MRKSKKAVAVLIVLAALACLGGAASTAWTLTAGPPQVSVTSIMRLKAGMTEADVAAVLGPATADVTARPPAGVPAPAAGERMLEYAGARATARLAYDADGKLVRWYPAVRTVTATERLRLRLASW
jgi:hypothetical protein